MTTVVSSEDILCATRGGVSAYLPAPCRFRLSRPDSWRATSNALRSALTRSVLNLWVVVATRMNVDNKKWVQSPASSWSCRSLRSKLAAPVATGTPSSHGQICSQLASILMTPSPSIQVTDPAEMGRISTRCKTAVQRIIVFIATFVITNIIQRMEQKVKSNLSGRHLLYASVSLDMVKACSAGWSEWSMEV